jgi:hypothetical protein
MDLDTLGIVKLIGLAITVTAAIYSLTAAGASEQRKRIILIFWLVGPPIFFYAEYFFQAPLLKGEELERFKDLQQRAASIWAGISAALTIAYFKKR